jgi:hypothetical protein
MEILGLGTQVMECARVRQLIDEHADAFLKQMYTEREVRFCNGKKQTTCMSSRPSTTRPTPATTTRQAIAATMIMSGRCQDRTSDTEMDKGFPQLERAGCDTANAGSPPGEDHWSAQVSRRWGVPPVQRVRAPASSALGWWARTAW